MNVMEIFETMDYGPAPEAAAPALAWLKERQPFGLFINNQWVKPASGQYLDSINPSTGKPLTQIAAGNSADVDAAVAAARGAFELWGKTPGHIRARYMYAIARHIQKHSRLLAVLESLDNGKPIRETRDIDIPLVARHFYYHAGWAQLMASPRHGQYRRTQTRTLYLPDRPQIRRDHTGDWSTARSGQHRDRRGVPGR